eukprot:182705-Chlamydomonas_euryale.AAC.19
MHAPAHVRPISFASSLLLAKPLQVGAHAGLRQHRPTVAPAERADDAAVPPDQRPGCCARLHDGHLPHAARRVHAAAARQERDVRLPHGTHQRRHDQGDCVRTGPLEHEAAGRGGGQQRQRAQADAWVGPADPQGQGALCVGLHIIHTELHEGGQAHTARQAGASRQAGAGGWAVACSGGNGPRGLRWEVGHVKWAARLRQGLQQPGRWFTLRSSATAP